MSENDSGESKRLLRARDGRMVAGVASGLAAYFNIDVNLVRLGFGVLTIISCGLGILLYLIAWAVLPEEEEAKSILEDFVARHRS